MALNVHRNHKAYQGRGEGGRGYGGGGRKREIIYLSLHCHHQNDSSIKMGSDESHFNVSLIVRDKVIRQCPQTTTFEEKGEPKRIRTETPLLTSLRPYRYAKPVHERCLTPMPLSWYIGGASPAAAVCGQTTCFKTQMCAAQMKNTCFFAKPPQRRHVCPSTLGALLQMRNSN